MVNILQEHNMGFKSPHLYYCLLLLFNGNCGGTHLKVVVCTSRIEEASYPGLLGAVLTRGIATLWYVSEVPAKQSGRPQTLHLLDTWYIRYSH